MLFHLLPFSLGSRPYPQLLQFLSLVWYLRVRLGDTQVEVLMAYILIGKLCPNSQLLDQPETCLDTSLSLSDEDDK